MDRAHLALANPYLGSTDADHFDGQQSGVDEAGGRGVMRRRRAEHLGVDQGPVADQRDVERDGAEHQGDR